MLQNNQTDHLQILCVFQQGTPLREFVIIQSGNRIAIIRISEAVFDFLVSAGIHVCEPVMVPPGNLAGENLLCVFQADLGTQEPIPFVVTQNEATGEISIIQITREVSEFLRTIGVPVCILMNAS